MYTYQKSEPSLWTVGYYGPNWKWEPESDHDSPADAEKRVAYLNGDSDVQFLSDRIEQLEATVERQAEALSDKYQAQQESMLILQKEMIAERDSIIDDLQASLRAAEDRITELSADCEYYKAGFNAAHIALNHVSKRSEELVEQLNYAHTTILKQAQRLAVLEASFRHLHDLACDVGQAFRMARVGETTEDERRNREALYAPYEPLAKAIDALVAGVPAENPVLVRIQELEELVTAMVDDENCWYDHNGHCQAHNWFDNEAACPHKRAKELGIGVAK